MKKDYYAILGVSKTATPEEIKRAYRAKSRQTHPDLAQGGADSESRMAEINEAYAVLSDPILRRKYDGDGDFSLTPDEVKRLEDGIRAVLALATSGADRAAREKILEVAADPAVVRVARSGLARLGRRLLGL